MGSVAGTNINTFETEGEKREQNRIGTGVRRGGPGHKESKCSNLALVMCAIS